MTNYAYPLRAIGQALELLDIHEFYMEPHGKYFLVAWEVPLATRTREPVDENVIRHVWGLRPDQSFSQIGLNDLNRQGIRRLELRYSAEDVERLDLAGKAQRQRGQTVATATRLSHLLRAIGEHLNQKQARLMRILRCGESVTVEFKTATGAKGNERFTLSELSEISVWMSLQRAQQTLH